jgi:hypothetical protein
MPSMSEFDRSVSGPEKVSRAIVCVAVEPHRQRLHHRRLSAGRWRAIDLRAEVKTENPTYRVTKKGYPLSQGPAAGK